MKLNISSRIGAWACVFACTVEFLVEGYAATRFAEYDSARQTISYLGHIDSPVYQLILFWGACFAFLFVIFAMGFRKAFTHFKYVWIGVVLILIYGVAQGLGGAYFPMNITNSSEGNFWDPHDLLSGFADFALVLFPFLMQSYFSKVDGKGLRTTNFIAWSGLIMVLLFLMSKYFPESGLGDFEGLLQRIFQAIYYVYFIYIAVKMMLSVEESD